MQDKELRHRIVNEICKERETDPAIVFDLLALEDQHRDLFAYGARPNLRRDVEKIVDRELERQRKAGGL